jgi:formylmethanofuran dehydrogenase subunit E
VTEIKETQLLIENAAKLHGHLGPFLVIGVRMGELAKRHLEVDDKSGRRLEVSIKTPLSTPFSCVIDGIQASTSCTVGNRKLKIENSTKEITAHCRLQESKKTIRISVNPKIAETLISDMSKGANAEQLAAKIANMEEEQLFVLEKQARV